ncbi:MAG: hypothetical protein KAR42_14110 [candidate division Zixibacteria bacterium]|nr:hypothetical protein [candidate division Zixibacteria bacterium]
MLKTIFYITLTLLAVVALVPDCLAGDIATIVSIDSLPPSVIKTVPPCGDEAVSPELSEISVTFSKEMKVTGHCWSWCSVSDESFPKLNGKPEYLDDKRTCVLHVTLEPDKTYAIWINVDKFQSFQDPEKHPAVPYLLVFKTRSVK